MRLFGRPAAAPATSYGYEPPPDATVRGWRCPSPDCGTGEGNAPRRWPFRCPQCGGPADPEFDEPWAHDARGPLLRNELRMAGQDIRPFWHGQVLAWMYADALRDGDRAVAEDVRSDVHRFVERRAGGIDGDLHLPVVQQSLAAGLVDVAADELGFWHTRAETGGVEDDNTRRTNCRQLLCGLLDLLEHPDGARHPRAPELTAAATRLRDDIRDVLTADLLRRSRDLRADRFVAAGPREAVPDGTVEQMIVFGRHSFDPMGSDVDSGDIWSRIAGPRYPRASSDPDGFCADLAAAVLPVGGWAVYGAQRLVVDLIGGEYGGVDYLRMQDAALAWLHANGVSAAHLNGWESARWAATHGAGGPRFGDRS